MGPMSWKEAFGYAVLIIAWLSLAVGCVYIGTINLWLGIGLLVVWVVTTLAIFIKELIG